jgi:hypothetical protein
MMRLFLVIWMSFIASFAHAVQSVTPEKPISLVDLLTDKNGNYIGPTVEDQVKLMDTDHNGFADVFEVRAYLELQHGKGYEKELLDKLVRTADRHSCGTSITNELTDH